MGYGYQDGRLSALSISRDGTTTSLVNAIEYAAMSNQPTQVSYGNGLVRTHQYDQDLRLVDTAVKDGSQVVQHLGYDHSAGEEITRIGDGVDASLSQDLAYDALSRLGQISRNGTVNTIAYDANGNATVYDSGTATRTSSIDAASNRLLGYANTDHRSQPGIHLRRPSIPAELAPSTDFAVLFRPCGAPRDALRACPWVALSQPV